MNRMTFYYHFQDIYDLVEWSCEEDAQLALAWKKTYQTWQDGFLNIFHFVEAEKLFVLNVYHSVSRDRLERYLYQATYDLLMGVVEEQSAAMDVAQSDKEFMAGFYKYGFVGIVLE